MYGSDDRTTQLEDQRSLVTAIDQIKNEQTELRKENAELRVELKKNTDVTARIDINTKEIVELFTAAKGTFKFFGVIGKAITWSAGVATAGGVLWLIVKGWIPPWTSK